MRKFRKKSIITVAIALLLACGLVLYELNSYSETYGLFWINNKEILNNEYFLSVGYYEPWIKLECTEKVYSRVIVDERVSYNMEFKTKVHYPYQGKLISIDLEHIYDNRE